MHCPPYKAVISVLHWYMYLQCSKLQARAPGLPPAYRSIGSGNGSGPCAPSQGAAMASDVKSLEARSTLCIGDTVFLYSAKDEGSGYVFSKVSW